jgi:spermidine synthase
VTWFEETLHDDLRQRLRVSKVLYREKTEHQDLIIFENPSLGRVLALDGVVQTTEADEHIYHEMLSHVPIIAHGSAGAVLIIGGGDGGMLREVLKHGDIAATMVEIDPGVIALCREHLPSLSRGAFDDPRAKLVIADGAQFVAETEQRFDVIIIDSTDPIGPGEVLFGADFYAGCRRCLNRGGVLVTQNGVPFVQPDELRDSYRRLSALFADVAFYLASVPTYNGGSMAFGWASDEPGRRNATLETITTRYRAAGIETRYYNPEIHLGAFALPGEIRALLA